MKKCISAPVAALLALVLFACGKGTPAQNDPKTDPFTAPITDPAPI